MGQRIEESYFRYICRDRVIFRVGYVDQGSDWLLSRYMLLSDFILVD